MSKFCFVFLLSFVAPQHSAQRACVDVQEFFRQKNSTRKRPRGLRRLWARRQCCCSIYMRYFITNLCEVQVERAKKVFLTFLDIQTFREFFFVCCFGRVAWRTCGNVHILPIQQMKENFEAFKSAFRCLLKFPSSSWLVAVPGLLSSNQSHTKLVHSMEHECREESKSWVPLNVVSTLHIAEQPNPPTM